MTMRLPAPHSEQREEILQTLQLAGIIDPIAYISGPMTGFEAFNYPAFDRAQKKLESLGFRVINPAENYARDTSRPYTDYMRVDIASVAASDVIVLLEGHRESKGANREKLVAFMCGIPCFELVEDMLFESICPYDVTQDLPVLAVKTIEDMLQAGFAKGHQAGSWRTETPEHHLRRTVRHSATTEDLLHHGGTFQDETAEDHANRALCRAAMACATIKKNTK